MVKKRKKTYTHISHSSLTSLPQMREGTSRLIGVVATVLLLSVITVHGSSAGEELKAASSSSVPESIMRLSTNENLSMKGDKERFIFHPHSTTTYTVVSVSTTTAFFTCLTDTDGTICQGRRKKRDLRNIQELSEREERR